DGYPGTYRKGLPISGLPTSTRPTGNEDVIFFHAGTRLVDGQVVTNGGRVLGVTGTGRTLKEARDRAYQALGKISFEGMRFRSDIGRRGLKRLGF
ncbi:MAG: phosphoribosylglycinamide synthetase C domain-containing protein, partial [candidate division WOR-3 bacterium]